MLNQLVTAALLATTLAPAANAPAANAPAADAAPASAAAVSAALPLGDADLAESRTTETLARGVTLTEIVRGTDPAPSDEINTTSRDRGGSRCSRSTRVLRVGTCGPRTVRISPAPRR